jgi:thiosulfate/3-mercaptopyruvate sulfurtransferase
MRRLITPTLFLFGLLLSAGTDPWTDNDLVQPEQVSNLSKDVRTPLLIHVGFPVLYRASHITGSVYAGPGSKEEGIADLKKAVAGQPRTREIILYCGCCPFDKCPNIRPAFAALHEMGFTHVKVMVVPTNLKTDWIDKGYPTDKHAE